MKEYDALLQSKEEAAFSSPVLPSRDYKRAEAKFPELAHPAPVPAVAAIRLHARGKTAVKREPTWNRRREETVGALD